MAMDTANQEAIAHVMAYLNEIILTIENTSNNNELKLNLMKLPTFMITDTIVLQSLAQLEQVSQAYLKHQQYLSLKSHSQDGLLLYQDMTPLSYHLLMALNILLVLYQHHQ